MASKRVSCGRDFPYSSDINNTLDEGCKNGYDFMCVPIVNPRFRREFLQGPAKLRPGALTRSDMILTSADWSSLIVGKVSPWIRCDSDYESIRKNSEKAFKQELVFMSHLSLPAILIPVISGQLANQARILNEHMSAGHNQQMWLRIPMKSAADDVDDVFDSEGSKEKEDENPRWKHDTWEWWNRFRTLCDFNKKLGLALELSADLPSDEEIDRWCSEPVKSLFVSTSLFLTNKKGYPVLARSHQKVIKKLFKMDCQMIITGVNRHPEKGLKTYQQYLDHLWQNQDPLDDVSQFAKGYEDYLQCPLQPLMDNLESQTYEIFEKDPVKYSQYQKAVYRALLDRVSDEEKDTKTTVVMVVGAGRGPLVRGVLVAAQKADRKVRVYAVEKNPNAVVTLENMRDEMWEDRVTVVSCDMRLWEAPEKADILVSELLGSFGDNELSPECLDGAEKFMKEDGISIPSEYTSYLAPLQSSKLYNEVRMCRDKDKHAEAMFEMPYVVRLHNCKLIDEPKAVFKFEHPNQQDVVDNNRFITLDFKVKENCLLHAFAGYFEAVLYKDVTLSIHPETHSEGMFSWFPILFPVKDPMYLEEGNSLQLQFWRCCTEKNVWYEWCVTEPRPTALHNPKGRSYTIGL